MQRLQLKRHIYSAITKLTLYGSNASIIKYARYTSDFVGLKISYALLFSSNYRETVEVEIILSKMQKSWIHNKSSGGEKKDQNVGRFWLFLLNWFNLNVHDMWCIAYIH